MTRLTDKNSKRPRSMAWLCLTRSAARLVRIQKNSSTGRYAGLYPKVENPERTVWPIPSIIGDPSCCRSFSSDQHSLESEFTALSVLSRNLQSNHLLYLQDSSADSLPGSTGGGEDSCSAACSACLVSASEVGPEEEVGVGPSCGGESSSPGDSRASHSCLSWPKVRRGTLPVRASLDRGGGEG